MENDPALHYLQNVCRARGIKDSGTMKVTLNRLIKYDEKKSKKTSIIKTIKKNTTTQNKIGALYSSEKNPMSASYKAHTFIQEQYNGNLDKAKKYPEWRKGTGGKIRLMVPDWRNTKGGPRVRWVLFK
tara:strand:+ start:3925 stop:4308 length:384 start_codon:yes stop_codon:yes gene_type:complete